MRAMNTPAATGPVLLVDVAERIATLTLNRPTQRNALSSSLLKALRGEMANALNSKAIDQAFEFSRMFLFRPKILRPANPPPFRQAHNRPIALAGTAEMLRFWIEELDHVDSEAPATL